MDSLFPIHILSVSATNYLYPMGIRLYTKMRVHFTSN